MATPTWDIMTAVSTALFGGVTFIAGWLIAYRTYRHRIKESEERKKERASEKRTELLDQVNMQLILLEALKAGYITIDAQCKECKQCENPMPMLDGTIERIDSLINTVTNVRDRIEALNENADPIKLELLIPIERDCLERVQAVTRAAEPWIRACKEAAEKRKASTPHIMLPGESPSKPRQRP